MALVEDAASVLDSFVHDAANLPAEIAHLLEEIQAKDKQVADCRNNINIRDNSLQRHVKAQGGHVKHPKEDQMVKTVLSNYETAQALQDDKVALSEKARLLLDRHVKRLDIKIRDLQNEGSITEDHQLPSLLHACPANLVDPDSSTSTGANTPLNAVSFHSATTNIANAAMARMANNAAQSNRIIPSAPVAGMQPHPLLGGSGSAHRQREMSAGANDPKRRRLNATLGSLPNPSSSLARAASMGPGTPKAGTPGSRAGSAGPRAKKPPKKLAPHQQSMRKKISKHGISKKSARRLLNGNRASPSTTGDDNSEGSGSEIDNVSASQGHDGADDEDMEDAGYDDEGEDNKLYCFCRSVSHGDMVACDNAKCEFEWFHWECVGLTSEPKGRWLCPTCKKLPQNQIKLAK